MSLVVVIFFETLGSRFFFFVIGIGDFGRAFVPFLILAILLVISEQLAFVEIEAELLRLVGLFRAVDEGPPGCDPILSRQSTFFHRSETIVEGLKVR